MYSLLLFLLAPSADAQSLRVASWNIETVGARGEAEYEAAVDVLLRLRPDVILVNEIADAADATELEALGEDADLPYVFVASGAGFGADRDGVLSRYPLIDTWEHTTPDLTGDDAAWDITRFVVEVTVDLTNDNVGDLTVIGTHWKSGSGTDDQFRRAIESRRVGQVLDRVRTPHVVVLGDVNESLDDLPLANPSFHELPGGLPASFALGHDIQALLDGEGLRNDPFMPLVYRGLRLVSTRQLDGDSATQIAGNRLDYLMVSPDVRRRSEIYDSADEWIHASTGRGLHRYGNAPPADTSEIASDHFPVVADLILP